MPSSFINVCRFNPTAGGTADWTLSSNVVGYQSPAAAGVVNGATYSYRAESADLTQWEVGFGTYNTGTSVLARSTVLFNSAGTGTGAGQSGAGSKINFSATPQVAIVALAEDVLTANVTKAIQQTGTDAAKGVTPATQQHHDSAAKAWVNLTGATGAINNSYNVSGVVRNATGSYTITFTTAFASADYIAVANAIGTQATVYVSSISSTNVTMQVLNAIGTAAVDPTKLSVVMFGRQ